MEDICNGKERYESEDPTLKQEMIRKTKALFDELKKPEIFGSYQGSKKKLVEKCYEWFWRNRWPFLTLIGTENQKYVFFISFFKIIYVNCNEYSFSLHYSDTIANKFYHFFRENGIPEEAFVAAYEERNKHVPGGGNAVFVCENHHKTVIIQEAERFEMFRDSDEPRIIFHCSSPEEVDFHFEQVKQGNVEHMYRIFGCPSEDRHQKDYDALAYH